MALKLMSIKMIGSITTSASAIVGGGFGINAAVNGGGNASNEITETHQTTNAQVRHATYKPYKYFVPENATPALKTYLTNTKDFVEKNTTTSSFMLVRIVQATSFVDFADKTLTCSYGSIAGSNAGTQTCKLHLITNNLRDNNIGKILFKDLKQIQNAKEESPKDSYIVMELTGDNSKWKDFENKEITVNHASSAVIIFAFDKLLYKQKTQVDNQEVEVLVPLKKNIISFLIEKNQVANLFQDKDEPTFFNCSLQERTGGSSDFKRKNNDDTCRIVKIDRPTSDEKTLITLDEIKKSSSTFTREDLSIPTGSKYIKLDVDANKFYGDDIFNNLEKNIIVSNENGDPKTSVTVKAANSIYNNEINGKINWLIVKNKQSTKTIKITKNTDACNATGTQPDRWKKTLCTLHLIEGQQPTTKGEFEKLTVNSTAQNGTLQLKENEFYVFQYPKKDNDDKLKINDPFYLYTQNGGQTSYEKHEFEITAFLMDNPTKENKALLLSEIGSLRS